VTRFKSFRPVVERFNGSAYRPGQPTTEGDTMNDFNFEAEPAANRARRADRVPGGWGVETAKAVGFMLAGAALAYGLLRASGGDVADRQTVKVIGELRAWAGDAERQTKFRAALNDLRNTGKELERFGK
jgi:hypothetical protein